MWNGRRPNPGGGSTLAGCSLVSPSVSINFDQFTVAGFLRPLVVTTSMGYVDLLQWRSVSYSHGGRVNLNPYLGILTAQEYGTGGATIPTYGPPRTTGETIHIAWVRASNTLRYMLVDGERRIVDTTNISGLAANVTEITLGSDQEAASFWCPAAWNAVLSDGELIQLSQGADPRDIRPRDLAMFFIAPGVETVEHVTGATWTRSGGTVSRTRYLPRLRIPEVRRPRSFHFGASAQLGAPKPLGLLLRGCG
jgi:hypothetical protein